MKLHAPAKINLTLDVLGKRTDGYHELRTVMASLRGLSDELAMEPSDSVSVDCTVPLPADNTAYRAAALFAERFGCGGARIHIEKHIPMQAGLGGGSADAAAVLRGMQTLYGYPANEDQLAALALQIGADVPFCLRGGVCLCEGVGEKIKEITDVLHLPVLLLMGNNGVSTGALFRSLPENRLRLPSFLRDMATPRMLAALRRGDTDAICASLRNDLQKSAQSLLPEIGENLDRLSSLGARGVCMSGSGACVFGIFESARAAQSAFEALENVPFSHLAEI